MELAEGILSTGCMVGETECEVGPLGAFQQTFAHIVVVWIDQVTIARPMVPEKDKTAKERRVFPTEVRVFLGRSHVQAH